MDINTLGVQGTAAAVAVAGSLAGGFSTRTYLDSTVQMGNANAAHWQEEVYQKIKYMREMYLSVLNKLHHKIASMVQQYDSLPQCPQHEQIEKLKMFKMSLERIVLFLGLNKHDIQLAHKEKLFSVEKHISFFLSSNRPRESSMQLQQPQSLDGQTDPSMQPAQGSMPAMQQNHLTNLQHNSLSGILTISNSQQHMINMVQPRSIVDLGQGNSLNSLQQAYLGFLQQNSNTLQQSLPKQHEQQMQQQLFHKQQLMQQQLIAQQNQLMGQQNTMPDVQQRLVGQQNNYNSLHQQQQLLNQQNNFQNMHQQQSGSQSNIAGVQQQQSLPKQHEQQMFQYHQQQQLFRRQQLMQQQQAKQLQQQLPGTQQPGNAGLTSNQHPINMLQQSKVPVQQQMLQSTTTLLPSQDSTAQMGNANAADWQEETYQKINSMKEMYLSEVNDLYQRIASKVQQHDSLPHRPQNEQIEKLKMFKMALERVVLYLQLNKHDIQLSHKEKLLAVEKHISFFLSANSGKPASSPLPGQLPESSMQQLIAHQTNVANLQRNQLMHQQTNQLEMEMQQRLQTSAPLLQQQNVMEQQKQLYQPQRAAPEASSSYENTNCASLDSTAQMGNANAVDWQDEVYQKIKSMKEMFLSELSDLYQKIASKVQQHDSLPHHPQNEQIEKLKMFKMTLERIVLYLQLNKHEIQLSHKEKLLSVEKHISFFLSANRPRKPASSPLQGQLPQSSMHTSLVCSI
ncbi:mediator of RNA polymerase II transcription subunit 15a-like isoform X2 [Lycium ferocissimum]|uniref:mediator of RNA polymerase II transcription subunit 15a-like isoform X2 n=1 Tax=Lycium ferocissimum TaxID=112874 RepID=UPI00281629DA|nr:mediator of RNA polymerase II transcription subunit 15a-like isoform X2 [Lycium ferocissimum]